MENLKNYCTFSLLVLVCRNGDKEQKTLKQVWYFQIWLFWYAGTVRRNRNAEISLIVSNLVVC